MTSPKPKETRKTVERCTWHKPSGLDFLSAHADAEERMAQGEKQRYCRKCKLYYWPHEWGPSLKITQSSSKRGTHE